MGRYTMTPRTIIVALLILLVVIVGIGYITVSLKEAAKPPAAGLTPSLDDAPMRLYGLVEPAGREVFVGPLMAHRVVEVTVNEGDKVEAGQVLCKLDADLERKALLVGESQLNEAMRRLDISLDDLRRKKSLASDKAIAEFELSQINLRAKLEEQQAATAQAEVNRQRVQVEKLTLRSPVDGIVYIMDVRVGEQLTPQDYRRIVVGRPEKQIRLFVETFWLDRVNIGDRFMVRKAETLREIGAGVIESISPYVGTRDFRTEDKRERLDTKYAQAILNLKDSTDVLIGMQVICERLGPSAAILPTEEKSQP